MGMEYLGDPTTRLDLSDDVTVNYVQQQETRHWGLRLVVYLVAAVSAAAKSRWSENMRF